MSTEVEMEPEFEPLSTTGYNYWADCVGPVPFFLARVNLSCLCGFYCHNK